MRKESEKVVATPSLLAQVPVLDVPDVRACFLQDATAARYETHCSETAVQQVDKVVSDEQVDETGRSTREEL